MDQLADETLRLIFSYLANPDALSKTCRRLNEFFLINYGATNAFWAAFGRSACLNEDVISILHSSGAHISRYLTQMVVHAYTRGRVAACPYRWAQGPKLSFNVFAHFLKLSATLYRDIDVDKNEDDGTKFYTWIRQKQGDKRTREKVVTWEFIESIFKDYGFIPFSPKDHILTAFPKALALDHRIFPLAKRNGLSFDQGFRDFVFRQVFAETGKDLQEGPRSIAITSAVKEISDLDVELFVSKNVVGEVLMEITTRKPAFESLKVLDAEGQLRFDLSEGVRDLIKTFRSTRSITTKGETIQELFRAFPTEDPVVREIVIAVVFLADEDDKTTRASLDALGLLPLRARDISGVLANSFTDNVSARIIELATDSKDVDVDSLLYASASRAIDNPCKGHYLYQIKEQMLLLREDDESGVRSEAAVRKLKTVLAKKIRGKFALDLKLLKQDPIKAGGPSDKFRTKTRIAYDYERRSDPYHLRSERYGRVFEDEDEDAELSDDEDDPLDPYANKETAMEVDAAAGVIANRNGDGDGDVQMGGAGAEPSSAAVAAAGDIASSEAGGDKVDVGGAMEQRTLTAKLGDLTIPWLLFVLISEDRTRDLPRRRRRFYNFNGDNAEERKKFPEKSFPVAAFVLDLFGPNDECARIFFDHAIVNGNLRHIQFAIAEGTLVSTRHFNILSKLGRAPMSAVWEALEFQKFFEEELEDADEKEEKKPEKAGPARADSAAAALPLALPMDVDAFAPSTPESDAAHLLVLAPETSQRQYSAPVIWPPHLTLPRNDDASIVALFHDPSNNTSTSDAHSASASVSTSIAGSRPRRSVGKQAYDVDMIAEEVDADVEAHEVVEVDDALITSKSKKVDKGKGKAIEKKSKGKQATVKEDRKAMAVAPFEKERLKWIVFLHEMLKDEDDKLKSLKKEHKAKATKGKRAEPVRKNEFHKSLATHFNILCNFDGVQRSNANVPAIANYLKLAARSGRRSVDNEIASYFDSELEEENEEKMEPKDEPSEDEEVDQLLGEDDDASRSGSGSDDAAAPKVPSKRKRAAPEPNLRTTTASKGKKPVKATKPAQGKKRKVDDDDDDDEDASPPPPNKSSRLKSKSDLESAATKAKPKPKPKAVAAKSKKIKAVVASTSSPKAAKPKPKANPASARGKGKDKQVSVAEDDKLDEGGHIASTSGTGVVAFGRGLIGGGDSELSELSEEEKESADSGGNESNAKEVGEGWEGGKGGAADDSGVFVDEEGEQEGE